jgi:DNA-binding SARP family transcriptional activator/DNA-binding CsgD family transcriptional regulator
VARPRTRIQLCGHLEIEIEGERLEGALPGRQGRLLFAYLALNRERPVRRDELVDALWPETDPTAAEGLLRPALSRLRKAIGGDRVAGRGEPALVLPEGAWVDWEAARQGLVATRAGAAVGDWRAAVTEASAVVEIADRGLLPELEAEWLDERRRELAELRVEALEALATAGVALGTPTDVAAAERAARAAVEAAPFRESARAALMEALRASGNVAEAIRAFDDLRTMLSDELGTTPGARLVRLNEELLKGDAPAAGPAGAAAAWASPGPARPVPGQPPASAPPASRAASPRRARSGIVERDDELGAVERLLADAAGREGRTLLVEGPAGIGKSRLLAEARRLASAAPSGTRVLAARGSEFERAFPFGVVRQLFEAELADPARRRRALAGAAAPAAAVFAAPGDDPGAATAGSDGSFAALHGLFWLTVNLASEGGTLMLAIDDLQWCDRPSLRFVAYLAQRLEGLPVLLAGTIRSGEETPDATLLAEIAQNPTTVSIRPRPLSPEAVTEFVRARLGTGADEAFCAACHSTTAGNPLLLRQLVTALESDGVRPSAENADAVAQIGPGAVSRSVLLRVARLGDEAVAVARAAAVLGENASLPAIAAMAGLGEDTVARATGALARAEILRPERPVGFVHPLVRDAVYHELPVGERELQHSRAARMLHETDAPAEQVAAHLLAVPPASGEPWTVERLEDAGREAIRRGAPDSAVTYLRRALEEETSLARRPRVLFELGLAEGLTSGPVAAAHLRAAYGSITDPFERARVAEVLARTLLYTGDAQRGREVAREAAAALPPEEDDLRGRLEALEMVAVSFGVGDPAELRRLEAHREPPPPGASLGARMLAAVASLQWAYAAGPAARCAELARAALHGGELVSAENGMLTIMPIFTLVLADQDDTVAIWDQSMAEAHRRGSLFAASTVHVWRGGNSYYRGELVEAEELLRTGIEEIARWGHGGPPLYYARGFLAAVLTSRGDTEAAWEQVDALSDPGDTSDGTRSWMIGRAELLMTAGRYEEAIELAEDAGRRFGWIRNPAVNPWKGLKSICLWELGQREEGLALSVELLEVARAWGAASALAPGLRVVGTMKGDEGLPELRESVAVVESSPNRHQHARSLVALGSALLRRGDVEEARELLEQAVRLGEASGSRPVVARARAELSRSGVRPTLGTPTGASALTPTERRIAELAAGGRSDREIAEALYATPHDVGRHLQAALRKLGVGGREELGAVLVPG